MCEWSVYVMCMHNMYMCVCEWRCDVCMDVSVCVCVYGREFGGRQYQRFYPHTRHRQVWASVGKICLSLLPPILPLTVRQCSLPHHTHNLQGGRAIHPPPPPFITPSTPIPPACLVLDVRTRLWYTSSCRWVKA